MHLTGASAPEAGAASLFEGLLQHAPTWADVEWLRGTTRLPLLLKGVLHPQDALEAIARGADGLIVSNHGGRTLDTAPATAAVLPRIVAAVGTQVPVLVDGGIRRGTDVLKAVALGARAVLVGRPMLHALAAAGPIGVAHALRLLRDELEIALALTGCATLSEVSPRFAFRSRFALSRPLGGARADVLERQKCTPPRQNASFPREICFSAHHSRSTIRSARCYGEMRVHVALAHPGHINHS